MNRAISKEEISWLSNQYDKWFSSISINSKISIFHLLKDATEDESLREQCKKPFEQRPDFPVYDMESGRWVEREKHDVG
tara:strand:+ start:456 stop:692 length:237 start_codon:yes stop_codon:yes gene_type:complete